MTCKSCFNRRQAGNPALVGCCFWTAIFHGDNKALKTALVQVNKKENFNINMESPILDKEAIGFLIDILIEDYAPKPLYEGWADLDQPYNLKKKVGKMVDSCMVLNPTGCCDFYEFSVQDTSENTNRRAQVGSIA